MKTTDAEMIADALNNIASGGSHQPNGLELVAIAIRESAIDTSGIAEALSEVADAIRELADAHNKNHETKA